MPADKFIKLLKQKLAQHGLDLRKDIIGIMTIGESLMKNLGEYYLYINSYTSCSKV